MSEDIAPDLFRALHELDAVKEENRAIQQKLTAAEAARDAAAGEVREMCAVEITDADHDADLPALIRNMPIPTPSAALQRVREEAQREGAERALRLAYRLDDIDAEGPTEGLFVRNGLNTLFPPAPQGEMQPDEVATPQCNPTGLQDEGVRGE